MIDVISGSSTSAPIPSRCALQCRQCSRASFGNGLPVVRCVVHLKIGQVLLDAVGDFIRCETHGAQVVGRSNLDPVCGAAINSKVPRTASSMYIMGRAWSARKHVYASPAVAAWKISTA